MSRVGKRPIPIPEGVEVKLMDNLLTVKGPKGELRRIVDSRVRLQLKEGEISVLAADETRESRSLHGLFRVLIDNMVTGVTRGFERALEIVGVGYRAELNDRTAVFNVGYSRPVSFPLPDGIEARIEKTKVILSGIDKELLGQTAARIRNIRRPEPYKGKGIKYVEEVDRRKAGKAGAK